MHIANLFAEVYISRLLLILNNYSSDIPPPKRRHQKETFPARPQNNSCVPPLCLKLLLLAALSDLDSCFIRYASFLLGSRYQPTNSWLVTSHVCKECVHRTRNIGILWRTALVIMTFTTIERAVNGKIKLCDNQKQTRMLLVSAGSGDLSPSLKQTNSRRYTLR